MTLSVGNRDQGYVFDTFGEEDTLHHCSLSSIVLGELEIFFLRYRILAVTLIYEISINHSILNLRAYNSHPLSRVLLLFSHCVCRNTGIMRVQGMFQVPPVIT